MNNSKRLALCGIAAALGSIFLFLVKYAPTGKITLFALSSVAIMLPLAKKLYSGAVLTVIATALIAFLMGGLTVFLPYLFVFGVHPLINALMNKLNFKQGDIVIKIILKLIYYNLVLFFLYEFAALTQLIPEYIEFYLLSIVLSIAFIPYDFLMQALQKRVEYYINRFVK